MTESNIEVRCEYSERGHFRTVERIVWASAASSLHRRAVTYLKITQPHLQMAAPYSPISRDWQPATLCVPLRPRLHLASS